MSRESALGVIGLGAMGTPMAQQLLSAGRQVFFHSQREKPELVEAGAVPAASPAELASQAKTLLVMLPDLPQLTPLLRGKDGLLSSQDELLICISSTAAASHVRQLAEEVSAETEQRVQIIDTPVSGGVEGARAGSLSIMAGGTEDQVTAARAALSACGRVLHMGPLGAGQVSKACNQMVVASTMLALSEATVMAERSGILPSALLEVLGGGYAGSTLLEAKKHKLTSEDYSPDGRASYMLKDLGFAREIAAETSTSAVGLPELHRAYRELVDKGLGDFDLAVTRRFVAER